MNSLIAWVLASSAAITTIAALRPIVRRYCGAVAVLNLWWIVPLSFVAMLVPKKTTLPVFVSLTEAAVPATNVRAASIAPAAWSWNEIGLCVWMVGTLIAAGWMYLSHRAFTRRINWHTGPRGTLPAECGPASVGAWRARLALPVDFQSRYTAAERKLILLHEYIHVYRRDGLVNLAMSALLALQWFNPLMHWASRAIGRDQECACDAIVISRHPKALRTYAEALSKSLPELPQHLPLVSRWHTYHPIIERISMLKTHRDFRASTRLAIAFFVVGAACAGALAYAAQPATLEAEPADPIAAAYEIDVSVERIVVDANHGGQSNTQTRQFRVAVKDDANATVDLGAMRLAMHVQSLPAKKLIRVDTRIDDTILNKIIAQPAIVAMPDQPAAITIGDEREKLTIGMTIHPVNTSPSSLAGKPSAASKPDR
jgi:beta-lactamase regulating signal transducer with metallopeptidase domain